MNDRIENKLNNHTSCDVITAIYIFKDTDIFLELILDRQKQLKLMILRI